MRIVENYTSRLNVAESNVGTHWQLTSFQKGGSGIHIFSHEFCGENLFLHGVQLDVYHNSSITGKYFYFMINLLFLSLYLCLVDALRLHFHLSDRDRPCRAVLLVEELPDNLHHDHHDDEADGKDDGHHHVVPGGHRVLGGVTLGVTDQLALCLWNLHAHLRRKHIYSEN